MKKILVPTNFSKLSKVAFNTATEIALITNAEIHVLHGSFLYDPVQKEKIKKTQMKAEKKQMKHLEKLRKKANKKNIPIKTHFCNTKIVSEIISYSNNNIIDLIVMATDDYKKENEYLEDSNTLKIIRLAALPVLVIKDENYKWKTNEIIFASDFKKEALPAFQNLLAFVKPFNLKINLIRIGLQNKLYNNLEKVVAPFAATCPKENLGMIWEHHDTSIEEGINFVSKKFGYCTIAIASHHREYDHLFYKDALSETIIFNAKTPVLTLPISIKELV